MGWLWIPVFIWIVGLMIMASPLVIKRIIRNNKHKLRRKSQESKPVDKSKGIYFTIEEEILDRIRHNNICLITSIIGVFVFSFGFIALGFIFG